MKTLVPRLAALSLAALALLDWGLRQDPDVIRPPGAAGAPLAFLPLFEKNVGQTDATVRYLGRGPGYTLFLAADEAVVSSSVGAFRMAWSGGGKGPRGLDRAAAASHYLIGGRADWRLNVPNYRAVRYADVHAGVDLVFRPGGGGVEYDFVVAARADPGPIALEFGASDGVALEDGDLVLRSTRGEFRHRRPVAYQEFDGERRLVEAEFTLLADGRVGFALGSYDRFRELVIDPVIDFAGYLGRGDDEQIRALSTGADGSIYVAGFTASSDFPARGVSARSFSGSEDAFVARLDPTGSELIYSTFLGGSKRDRARSLAVDAAGAAYVVGETASEDFPTQTNSFQRRFAGGEGDAFIAKLSSDGDGIIYSSFVGGSARDWATGVAIDGDGAAFLAGGTAGSSFPTTPGAVQPLFGGGDQDGFVVKLDPSGSIAIYSTFLGGERDDEALGAALAPDGRLWVTGFTRSNRFPVTPGVFQAGRRGDNDAFLAALDASGARLIYSSYFGGGDDDFGNAVALDAEGAVHIVGSTESDNLPVSDFAFDRSYGGRMDGFIAKFSPFGALLYASYLGGDREDFANAAAVDAEGRVSVTGHTKSADFPVVARLRPIQSELGSVDGDAFWARVAPDGRELIDSTYLGGERIEEAFAVALDPEGVVVAGRTRSDRFPATAGVFQGERSGGEDGFIARIFDNDRVSVVSAAAFEPLAPLAPESIASAFGRGLAATASEARMRPLPAELAGTRVSVVDSAGFERSAALIFVSPRQINFVIPAESAEGTAEARVWRDGELIAFGPALIRAASPALFSADNDGRGPAAGVVIHVDELGRALPVGFTFSGGVGGPRTAVEIDLNAAPDVVVSLFGTGFRRASLVTALVDGEPVEVLFAGPQPEFAGLDQVNVRLPKSLGGRGLVEVVLIADGSASNAVELRVR